MAATLAIVIPTFNEADNAAPLVEQLRQMLQGVGWGESTEVVFVDDSTDHTPAVIAQIAVESDLAIRVVHRPPHERIGGLGGAVLVGMQATTAATIVVMDGDLQHPPGTIPGLVRALDGHDVAVASRYCGAGGDARGLASGLRRAVSSSSTLLTRSLFPRSLRDCTDPMTGFFALRRSAIDVDALRPLGFKILLEILVRNRLRVAEVPFIFGDRNAGDSKASVRQGIHFLRQVAGLRLGRALNFLVVGATGLVVNIAIMAALVWAGLNYVPASIVATEVSIVWNFVLYECFVFRDRRGSTTLRRAAQCLFYNNLEFLLRLPLLMLLVALCGMGEVWAQFLTVVLAFFARFAFTSRVVYRTDGAPLDVGAKASAMVRSIQEPINASDV